jgi:hypothetical protein
MSTFGAEPVDTTPPCIITASGVTTYATVAELYGEVGLATGYYEVPDVGITYWDGVTFFPYLPYGGAPMSIGPNVADDLAIKPIDAYTYPSGLATTLTLSTLAGVETGSAWSAV